MRVAVGVLGIAVWTVAASPLLAQSNEQKSAEQKAANEGKEKPRNEYAEAERVLGGPASNPECMWLGKRVVSLLWNDDLDTAFRHLDLYDRFGCPAGHVQMAFRCVIRPGPFERKDPKAQDTLKAQDNLEGRVHNCWLSPNTDPVIAPPAAASAASPSQAQ
jgi:hypothetical protein